MQAEACAAAPRNASRSCGTCRGQDVVKDWIADNLNSGKVVKESSAGSSSWSSAHVYHTDSGKKFFVKLSHGRDSSMFEGEALGLQALYGTILFFTTPVVAVRL